MHLYLYVLKIEYCTVKIAFCHYPPPPPHTSIATETSAN